MATEYITADGVRTGRHIETFNKFTKSLDCRIYFHQAKYNASHFFLLTLNIKVTLQYQILIINNNNNS